MKAIVLLIFLVLCVISTVNANCTPGGKGCPPNKTCIRNRMIRTFKMLLLPKDHVQTRNRAQGNRAAPNRDRGLKEAMD
ncbi:hypothetical protein ANCCAN_11793 [Ancylostoma caninum]|uniref:Uncharacterized protein n=1 Tax=Ancylostoma caninum TaxID=29170 RepID=A0A368GD12_ANCCA|nr:hypothetical protein ANCCAN_11793 [Ancylostoma caninum]